MNFIKKLNLLSYVYFEKLPYWKFGFGQTNFLVHFTMLGPKINKLFKTSKLFLTYMRLRWAYGSKCPWFSKKRKEMLLRSEEYHINQMIHFWQIVKTLILITCWLISLFPSFDFFGMFIIGLNGGMDKRIARRHTSKHLFKSIRRNMIWPCGGIPKGHWMLRGNLLDGCLDVSFEEGEEGEKIEKGDDDDDDDEVVEKPIGSHSKRRRSFHSSQATPRKVGKAKE